MPESQLYPINPDRTKPWNGLLQLEAIEGLQMP